MIEDLGLDEEDEEVLPMQNLKAAILRKVVEWASHHKDDENIEEREDLITAWDNDFFNVDLDTLFELMVAANFLDMKGLCVSLLKNDRIINLNRAFKDIE